MDIIALNEAATANSRIESFINDPDSTSGVVTVPTTIAAGETITIPAGRMAVLPDLQIDGDLVVDGEVFIPNGTSLSKVVEKVTSTDNAIVRFDGTTGAVQNSGVVIDDNNNVVIPGSSSGTNGGAFVLVKNGGTSNIGIGNYSALNGGAYDATSTIWCNGSLNITDNTTSRIKIDSAGNIGIGVTPSAWGSINKVIELGNQQGQLSLYGRTDGANNSAITQNAYRDSSNIWRYKANGFAVLLEMSAGAYNFLTAPSGIAGGSLTWTNQMVLNDSGLQVNAGNTNYPPSLLAQHSAGNYIYMQGRNTVDTTEVLLNLIGGVKKSAILANGSFQSATNSYGSTSDIKLKENVIDTSPKLEKLMKVQVRNFNYIGQEDKQIGVVAQEIEQVFPGIVYETKDTKQIEVKKERVIPAIEEIKDNEGNIIQEAKPETIEEYIESETIETGETTKNVKYSVIYMMMLKGMQEQQESINDLKSRIEILEGGK